jgi:hypothetical protein
MRIAQTVCILVGSLHWVAGSSVGGTGPFDGAALKGRIAYSCDGNDNDADDWAAWVEIGDLAANRGMYLHFHISYEADASADHATLRKERNLLALRYAKYGAVVNAADPVGLSNPSAPASGMSMIVSREGGHNQPAPKGIEYYLPYQTSVVKSAGAGPDMLFATRRTSTANNMDLVRFRRNRNRRQGGQPARYDWMTGGAALIGGKGSR